MPSLLAGKTLKIELGQTKMIFKLLYKLFSSNTHSFPMGFYRMLGGERGAGVKNKVEIGYNGLGLETA